MQGSPSQGKSKDTHISLSVHGPSHQSSALDEGVSTQRLTLLKPAEKTVGWSETARRKPVRFAIL